MPLKCALVLNREIKNPEVLGCDVFDFVIIIDLFVFYFKLVGRSCETKIDNCLGNDCRNGASCISRQNGYSCKCVPGYSGQFCEVNIDECAVNPCRHGQCRDGVNKYVCDCYNGYTGTNCHINIDDCRSK